MKNTETIVRQRDYKQVDVDYVEVLVDPREQVIGLMLHPHKGKPFVCPLDVDCARNVTTSLMRTLIGLSEVR
jgi:hypothetical protein